MAGMANLTPIRLTSSGALKTVDSEAIMERTTVTVSTANRDRLTTLAAYMTFTHKKRFTTNDVIGLMLDRIETVPAEAPENPAQNSDQQSSHDDNLRQA